MARNANEIRPSLLIPWIRKPEQQGDTGQIAVRHAAFAHQPNGTLLARCAFSEILSGVR